MARYRLLLLCACLVALLISIEATRTLNSNNSVDGPSVAQKQIAVRAATGANGEHTDTKTDDSIIVAPDKKARKAMRKAANSGLQTASDQKQQQEQRHEQEQQQGQKQQGQKQQEQLQEQQKQQQKQQQKRQQQQNKASYPPAADFSKHTAPHKTEPPPQTPDAPDTESYDAFYDEYMVDDSTLTSTSGASGTKGSGTGVGKGDRVTGPPGGGSVGSAPAPRPSKKTIRISQAGSVAYIATDVPIKAPVDPSTPSTQQTVPPFTSPYHLGISAISYRSDLNCGPPGTPSVGSCYWEGKLLLQGDVVDKYMAPAIFNGQCTLNSNAGSYCDSQLKGGLNINAVGRGMVILGDAEPVEAITADLHVTNIRYNGGPDSLGGVLSSLSSTIVGFKRGSISIDAQAKSDTMYGQIMFRLTFL